MPVCGPWFGPWYIVPIVGLIVMLVVLSIVLGPRGLFARGGWWGTCDGRSGRNDANDILRERYARGEITREQFEQMRRDLA